VFIYVNLWLLLGGWWGFVYFGMFSGLNKEIKSCGDLWLCYVDNDMIFYYNFDMDEILRKYKKLLIQKRYSYNTQKIYCNYFKDFVLYFEDKNLEKVSMEQINSYLLGLIKTKNISISQQNQRINAIKFYYEAETVYKLRIEG